MNSSRRVQQEFARQAETLSVAAAFTDATVLDRIQAATAPTATMRILDVGCGPGILAAALAPHAWQVVGLDLTPEMLAKARRRCQAAGTGNVRFQRGQAEALPFADGSFQAVVTRATLHHFPDPGRVLQEMARVAQPGGKVVVADVVTAEDAADAALHNALETLRDPSHVRMLPASEVQGLFQAAGLRVTSTSTWDMPREFAEWIRITNAPERSAPLLPIMRALAQAGREAGIGLRDTGATVIFMHRWLFVAAEKP